MTGRWFSHVAVVVSLVLMILLANASACLGDSVDGGEYGTIVDEKDHFDANGWWRTYDTTNDGLDGPSYWIHAPGSNHNWTFHIRHTVDHWTDNAAILVRVILNGTHWNGPCSDDGPANPLPDITDGVFNIPYNGGGQKYAQDKPHAKHPTSTGGNHLDIYSYKAKVTSHKGVSPDSSYVGGLWTVHAEHRALPPAPPEMPLDMGFGSGMGSGTVVVFNGGNGALNLAVMGIDILDAVGGLSGGIDPAYAGDPFLGGVFTITDMYYLGQDPDGRYRFSGCEVSVTDPAGNFLLEGGFEEYLIKTTVMGTELFSYAHDESLTIGDLAELADGASAFLDDFIDLDIMKQGYTESCSPSTPRRTWRRLQTVSRNRRPFRLRW
jgi:hypothetical protein